MRKLEKLLLGIAISGLAIGIYTLYNSNLETPIKKQNCAKQERIYKKGLAYPFSSPIFDSDDFDYGKVCG